MCYPSCFSSAGGFSVTLSPPLDPRTFSFCFDLMWPVRGGWQDPWGVADPRIFKAPLSCSSYSPWALWPLAAAPPWPPLSVADSTTQWLPLLKQSCFLPLASTHIHFFPYSRSASALSPPQGQRIPELQLWLLCQVSALWQCSVRLAPRGACSVPCPGTHTQCPPWSCLCAPALLPSSGVARARCGTLKPTKECQF